MWNKYLETNTKLVPTAENTQNFLDHLQTQPKEKLLCLSLPLCFWGTCFLLSAILLSSVLIIFPSLFFPPSEYILK